MVRSPRPLLTATIRTPAYRVMRFAALAAMLSSFGAVAARAQVAHGTVRDAGSGTPLSGVVVLMLDSASVARSRAITDSRGEYRVSLDPTVRVLRFLRIGFTPEERLAASVHEASGDVDVTMRALTQMLAPVRVQANPSCPRRGDTELAFSLWEQARSALLASVVAREMNPPRATRLVYKRTLSTDDRIAEQLVQIDSVAVKERPFVAVSSSEDFVSGGFARDTTGMRQYLAPYADVLLEDAFVLAHCFHVREGGTSRPAQLGLVFETGRRRRGRVDVDGVVWVDTAARVLVGLEFRYVGITDISERARPGGEIWFRQMTNGLLVIDHWHIRGQGARERPAHDELGPLPRIEVPIYATQYGGELVEASWSDGHAWHATLGKLAVRAVDSAVRPAPGFDLRLRGTNYVGHANEQGIMEIPNLLPGPYRAVVLDSLLGRVGLAPSATFEATIRRESPTERTLTLKSALQNFHAYCSASLPIASDEAVVVVRVRTPDGQAEHDASWEIRREAGKLGPVPPLVAQDDHESADGTLNRCLKFKKGDAIRVQVWREGQPRVTEERVLASEATVIGVLLPPNRP